MFPCILILIWLFSSFTHCCSNFYLLFCRSSVSLQRIPPTVQSPASPITLGFYKGTYGGHGVEILHLRMDDTGCLIHGDKILVNIFLHLCLYVAESGVYCATQNMSSITNRIMKSCSDGNRNIDAKYCIEILFWKSIICPERVNSLTE